MISHIQLLMAYHNWANRKFLDTTADLPGKEWTHDLGSSFPSVQATTAHLVGVEWVWLERWQGRNPESAPDWMNDPSAKQLRSILDEVEDQRAEILNGADFGRTVSYRLFDGSESFETLGSLVFHVVSHATYHRGQLATMLRQLGKKPPPTDFLVYMNKV